MDGRFLLRHAQRRACLRLSGAMLACAAALVSVGSPSAPVPGEGDWPMPAHDYASTRFSPLDEIKPANVERLQLAFSLSTGVDRGHEAAPVVVGDTMYVVTPWPNYLIAL